VIVHEYISSCMLMIRCTFSADLPCLMDRQSIFHIDPFIATSMLSLFGLSMYSKLQINLFDEDNSDNL
jgi:hypothetical protein